MSVSHLSASQQFFEAKKQTAATWTHGLDEGLSIISDESAVVYVTWAQCNRREKGSFRFPGPTYDNQCADVADVSTSF